MVLLLLAQLSKAGSSTTSPSSSGSAPPATDQNTTIIFINRNPPTGQSAKGLHFTTEPANGPQIISEAIRQLHIQGFGPAIVSQVNVEPPLPKYSVRDIEHVIASGNLVAEAKIEGYDYYSIKDKQSGKLIVTVDAVVNTTSGDASLGSIGFKPTTIIVDALDQVATLGPVLAGSFEARLLDDGWGGSPLHLVLWLKSAPGGTDLIYPNFVFPEQYQKAGLQKGTLYTLPDYLSRLQAADQRNETATAATQATNASKQVADAVKKAAIVVENQRKAASGEDTTISRLKSLEAALDKTLTALKRARPEFFGQTISDTIRAQFDVARGLEYVKAHPEIDALTMRQLDGLVTSWSPSDPISPFFLGVGENFSPRLISRGPPLPDTVISSLGGGESAAPSVPVAADALIIGLMDFLGNQSIGRPLVGEMGGNRDLIMRDIATATSDFMESTEDILRTINRGSTPRPRSFPVTTPAHPSIHSGSISGSVEVSTLDNSVGVPAANVMITFAAVDSLDWGKKPHRASFPGNLIPGSIPGAFSDEKGKFVIQNVPPGFYVLDAGNNWIVIEVKEDTETNLPTPLLTSPHKPPVGGRGGAG